MRELYPDSARTSNSLVRNCRYLTVTLEESVSSRVGNKDGVRRARRSALHVSKHFHHVVAVVARDRRAGVAVEAIRRADLVGEETGTRQVEARVLVDAHANAEVGAV